MRSHLVNWGVNRWWGKGAALPFPSSQPHWEAVLCAERGCSVQPSSADGLGSSVSFLGSQQGSCSGCGACSVLWCGLCLLGVGKACLVLCCVRHAIESENGSGWKGP